MIKVGDLVRTHMFGEHVFLGIVLDIQPMKGVYKDSHRGEKMNSVKILWEKPVPGWLVGEVFGKFIEKYGPKIKKWFSDNLKLTHPDDISGTIIKAVWCKVNNEPFDPKQHAQKYIEYWEKCNKEKSYVMIELSSDGNLKILS